MDQSPHTSIKSHGTIKVTPDETYGSGPLLLRIGNGGAGATGLIAALANTYLSTRPGSITWTMNHSRNTQLALLHGYADLALTYERDQEQIAVDERWARSLGPVFHDHFVLAGPLDDPAEIHGTDLSEGLRRIAASQCRFHSRADHSATMTKERALWDAAGVVPSGEWYVQGMWSPAEAVRCAEGAYLVTDRSTLLKQTGLGASGLRVFFEPDSAESVLMNSCYALVRPDADEKIAKEVESFVDWVQDEGQDVIRSFGSDVGAPLFAGLSEGFATVKLQGGYGRDGKWVWD